MNLRNGDRSRVTVHGTYAGADGKERAAIVIDLSAKGCRLLERLHPVQVGADITISFARLEPFTARVCWNEGSFYGLEFKKPLHQFVLNSIFTDASKGLQLRKPAA